MVAVQTAARQANVVSMSFGGSEFANECNTTVRRTLVIPMSHSLQPRVMTVEQRGGMARGFTERHRCGRHVALPQRDRRLRGRDRLEWFVLQGHRRGR